MEEELGQLSGRYKQLLHVLAVVPVERLLPSDLFRRPGRPQKHRTLLARAFLAKMVLDIPTTTALVERLRSDQTLRHLCGWERGADVPSESTFSRAFAEFAESDLPGRLHAALIKEGYSEQLVGHISRDSTAIVAR
ncbi:MAG: transposase [Bacteroidota bacterium]|nr:transposase [Bacteroidota bacterium]